MKPLRIVITPRAFEGLAAAVGHLLDRNVDAALRLRRDVEEALDLLASGTLEGRIATLSTGETTRRWVVAPLVIYYRRVGDELVVEFIHDGRRAPLEP